MLIFSKNKLNGYNTRFNFFYYLTIIDISFVYVKKKKSCCKLYAYKTYNCVSLLFSIQKFYFEAKMALLFNFGFPKYQ